MPRIRVFYIVTIKTEEASDADLYRDSGAEEGPVIDVIKKAVEGTDAFWTAEYLTTAKNSLPSYIVRVELSQDLDDEDFQKSMQDCWNSSKDNSGKSYPRASVET